MGISDWSSEVCTSERESPSDPHGRDEVDRPVRDVAAAEGDRTAAGGVDAVDDVEQRRLAGAVRPDDALNLAFLDAEIDSVEHDKAAETLLQPPNREQHPRSAPLTAGPASLQNGNGTDGGRAKGEAQE